jgi:hypothetical protein
MLTALISLIKQFPLEYGETENNVNILRSK